MVLQTLAIVATGLVILQETAQMRSPVIWTEDLATLHAKMGRGANFCCFLWAAGIYMMIFRAVEVFLEGQNWSLWAQVIWTEDLATSHAKMGLAANFCRSLSAAGTNTMILQVFLEGQPLSAIAAMDLVTLRAIVQQRLGFAEVLCQEVEVQFEGQWLTPAENSSTQPHWSVTCATGLDTSPETVSEAAVAPKSAA